ncbi:MAG: hypothetical protein HY430_02095 [Candidatus Levybacteria bacterium]|nr:hypothetical protein [Candidatus Levybacteria bacterium]
MEKKTFYIRNINAGNLLEAFLVAAVTSVLLIRFFLYMTGYPQLGGASFHIAHMLWGGLLMLLSIVLLLSFLSNVVLYLGAVIGGIGFGVFIDELGKFITQDNNYFFQPTVAILYIIFISLFLLFRVIDRSRAFSKKEYLLNALELLEEAVQQDMDKEEKQKVADMLAKADPQNIVVRHLKELIDDIALVPPAKPTLFLRLRHTLQRFYERLIQSPRFARLLILFFLSKSLLSLLAIPLVLYLLLAQVASPLETIISQLTFTQKAELITTAASGFLAILGILQIRRSRIDAYLFFRRSVLVSIFLTQFFAFYREQFSAILGLLFNLAVLLVLRYMQEQEELHRGAIKQRE